MPTGLRNPALIGAAVILAYANSLWGAFQFDDFNVIVFNPAVHSMAAWWADLGHGIRPLLKLSYTINWMTGAERPLAFHLFNVVVHGVNAVLVYALARSMLERYAEGIARRASAAALVAALFFAVHPAHTEAVTYVSGRSSSLMAMFYLGGIAAYVAGCRASGGARTLRLFVLSPLLFCFALATKETAVTYPFALLLWECTQCGPRDWTAIARRQAIHWILWFVTVAVLLAHPIYGARLVPDFDVTNSYRNLLTQIDAVSYLLLRLIIVYPLNIDPDLRTVAAWSPSLAVRAVVILGLVAGAVLALRRRPWWGFGILWFFLQLAPTNSLLPRLDLANDRQLYLASVGLVVALGAEVAMLWSRLAAGRKWVASSVAALLVLLAGFVVLRNEDYATEIRLWEQTARASPQKARAFNNLGFAYSAAGCLRLAEAAYREALRLNAHYDVARENLTRLLFRSTSTDTESPRLPPSPTTAACQDAG